MEWIEECDVITIDHMEQVARRILKEQENAMKKSNKEMLDELQNNDKGESPHGYK